MRVEQALKRVTDGLGRAHGLGRGPAVRQREEVQPLRQRQAERDRQALQQRLGDVDVPPLLQPCVPTDAHVGEPRQLLAAKARRAAPRTCGESHVLRTQTLTAAAKKARELDAPRGRFA